MKIVVVIPTYNESKNIGRLIEALNVEFKKIPSHEFHLLVVEGNSPDGTADVVKEQMKKYDFVHLLMEEKKAGLGAAYVYGFKYAMKELGADVLVEMDADFQHDPKELVDLIKGIDDGYDYIIGSRFTKGGSIPESWELKRKLFSKGGNTLSKIILGIRGVNDFTTGYKVSRVKGFADSIDLDNILSRGFAYKLDLLYKMHKAGAKIKEVPITFGLRDEGASKMEKNNLKDSLRVVTTLRLKDPDTQKFLKFCAVGFAGLFVDSALFNILRLSIRNSKTASLVSGFIAMLTTFTLNNFWSFKNNKIEGNSKKIQGFIIYILSSYVPIVFRSQLIKFSVSRFGDTFWVSNITFFIGIVVGLIWNYLVYSKIIWKDKNK
ncbi:MAG TPA: glycosyltransferase family 2 protein [bacterium]|nr:glycosyltransferase family 2 protein [bacterium]